MSGYERPCTLGSDLNGGFSLYDRYSYIIYIENPESEAALETIGTPFCLVVSTGLV